MEIFIRAFLSWHQAERIIKALESLKNGKGVNLTLIYSTFSMSTP
jgi:hypothetical protein